MPALEVLLLSTDLTVPWRRCGHTDQVTLETGRPTTLTSPHCLLVTSQQKMTTVLAPQCVTTNPPAFLPLTRHFSSSIVSLEEDEGWVMSWRGRGCDSWCYYCRYDDQYRPSPWQSLPRHVTMVRVVMALVAMVIFPSPGMSGSSPQPHLAPCSLMPSPTPTFDQ